MNYKLLTNDLQTIVDEKHDKLFRELLIVTAKLEQTDDIKLLKVVFRFKKLLNEIGDPFDYRKFELRDGREKEEVIQLTIKLIDFLNDYFKFLKNLK